ncbi:MAG: transposase, partial [Actinobacteria bacterium]|nr:transposase [Actinomycetota bacterium]
GTKLRANASRHKAMSYERMGTKAAKLDGEIAEIQERMQALLGDAEAVDVAEDEQYGPDRRGDELPAELKRREDRLVVIREAQADLEAEALEAETERRAQMAAEDKTPRAPRDGRDPFEPKPKAQRNFTDPESRIMKMSDGAFHQCYNGQAIVDSTTQIIVAADAFDMAADCPLLAPMLDQLDANLAAIGAQLPADAVMIADAGYFSEDNVQTVAGHGLDAYIATGRLKHTDPPPLALHDLVPGDATPKQQMAHKTKSESGHAIYARRKTIVEPVFGQMDTTQDAKHLGLRGKSAARKQWQFQATVHNLLKLYRNGGLALIPTG